MLSKHISLAIVGIAISLIAVGVISYTNTSDAADTYTDGNWTFTVDGTNATLISNTATEIDTLQIPTQVIANGTTYTVTAIGDGTSSIVNNGNLTANCVVTMPDTVTIINGYAFEGCSNISVLTLPSNLESIGAFAFRNCNNMILTSIPDSVTSIGDGAFVDCSNLVLTSLPSGLTSISNQTFAACTSLALTSLSDNITSIGSFAFNNCHNISLTSLPSGLTTISSYSFSTCRNLILTSLPSGLTSIGTSAFSGCTNLALTSLPDGVTTIGENAFNNCPNLALTELPDGLTTIGSYAFVSCTNLALTSLPDSITSIGYAAFSGCTSLAITELPTGLTSISKNVFKRCTGITSLILLPNLETIGDNAFEDCINLKTIYNASDLTLTIGGTDNGRVSQYAENVYDVHILTILSNNTSYGTVSQSTAYVVDRGTISVSGDTITISEPAQTIKATPTSPLYKLTRWANTTGEITANRPIVAVFEPNDEMTVSASPDTLYLVTGGPIPNTVSETVSLSYTGFGDGTYTWSIVNDGGTGVNVTADGRIYGTAGNVTVSPVTVTIRLTGTVDGITQTKDVTIDVMIVAKLIFTTNPINDGVIA